MESSDYGRRACLLGLVAASLAALATSSELLVGLSYRSWTALPFYFLLQSWAQVTVAGCLGLWLGFLGQANFRPWCIPKKLVLDPIHWMVAPATGLDWPCRLTLLFCLLPLVQRPMLALLGMFLVAWTRAGYQRWERHRSGGIEYLHHFFGVEWRTGCLSEGGAREFASGPRSDDVAYAARVGTSRRIAAVLASGVGLYFLMGPHYAGPLAWISMAYLMFFPGFLASRVIYFFLPSGLKPSPLPQRRTSHSVLVEDQVTGGLVDVGCMLLALGMGGFQLIGMVLAIPLFLAHEAAGWMGWPGGHGVAIVFLGLLGLFVKPKQRDYYELEAGTRELWQHTIKGPYQLSQLKGTVVALGLTRQSQKYLPVAYLATSKSIKLTRRAEDFDSAWRLVERISALLRLVPISAQMALEPKQVEQWIREGSLAKRVDIWAPPKQPVTEQPSWLPPVD